MAPPLLLRSFIGIGDDVMVVMAWFHAKQVFFVGECFIDSPSGNFTSPWNPGGPLGLMLDPLTQVIFHR